ncbi:unnamed protein product [Taenia asiatica]|uniref:Uncharacterized protein n=1 Tax=Taenia asiatica TaxID=60517 RepID=A0A0R3VV70_TAEAS|nr:unnamed protein product [Taenia asiatica]
MSDDEMRKVDIPCLQDNGYIFLWVTGRFLNRQTLWHKTLHTPVAITLICVEATGDLEIKQRMHIHTTPFDLNESNHQRRSNLAAAF